MRKLIFIILSALALASCNKSNSSALASSDEEISADFSINMDARQTKAASDGDGAGIYANQCRLQVVMLKGANRVAIYDQTKKVENFKACFNDIKLVKNQKYDFLFWADNKEGAYYVTDDLTKVSLASTYIGGDDQRDAFFASIVDTLITSSFSRSVKLYRPFGQINVITTDVKDLKGQLPGGVLLGDVTPDSVEVSFSAPSVLNVRTGEVSVTKTFSYKNSLYKVLDASKERNTLSMDYCFAAVEKDVKEIQFKAYNGTTGTMEAISHTFTNVPVQRNYRTNIIGELLTNKGVVNVEIVPNWYTPDYDKFVE